MEDGHLTRRALGLDVALAVVFTVSALVISYRLAKPDDRGLDVLAHVLIVGIGGSLALRRRAPVAVLATVTVCLAVYTLRDYPGSPVYVALLIALYTLASTRPRREIVLPTLLALGALLVAGAVGADRGEVIWVHVAFISWTAAAVFLGDAARNRRSYLAGLEQRARDLEETREEEARRRVAEERLRIARDLHDVIAHGIATIHMQSSVAAHVLDRHPEQARPALLAIKEVSRDTLAELRATLHVLREGDEAAPLAPTPGLGRIDGLVEMTRQAGLRVDLRRSGGERLPPAVDVTAFRIVQESLANVMRHAAASRATVTLAQTNGHLQIEVVDDGRGAPAAAEPGHGITGMRERAGMLGGTLEAGSCPGGGFRVRAELPLQGDGA